MSNSNVKAVVGLQLGDENKTQILDLLAKDADIVIKYQNGNNSERVNNEYGSFDLAIVPSSAFIPDLMSIISAGSFIELEKLDKEMEEVKNKTCLDLESLFIDERAYILMPYHLGAISELKKDIASGVAFQCGDLLDEERLGRKIFEIAESKDVAFSTLKDTCYKWRATFGNNIIDTLPVIRDSFQSECPMLVDAGDSTLNDALWGASSDNQNSSTLPNALYSIGLPPNSTECVYGVARAYTKKNDNAIISTKMSEDATDGWFDAVAVDHAAYINGVTNISLMDISALDTLDSIKVCIGYSIMGEYYATFPQTRLLENAKPIYADFEGWKEDTSSITSWDSLPEKCKRYILELEKFLNLPISIVETKNNLIFR